MRTNSQEDDPLIGRYRSALAPAPLALDEPSLWYEAGRAAAKSERRVQGWRAYSAVSTAACLALAFTAFQRGATPATAPIEPTQIVEAEPERPAPVEPVVVSYTPPQPTGWAALFAPADPDPESYLGRRDLALSQGIDALPEPSFDTGAADTVYKSGPPPTAAHLLEEYLPPQRAVAHPPAKPQAASEHAKPEDLV